MDLKTDAVTSDHLERIESLPARRASVDHPVHSKAPVWEEKGRSYGPAGKHIFHPIQDYCMLPTFHKAFEVSLPLGTSLPQRLLQL